MLEVRKIIQRLHDEKATFARKYPQVKNHDEEDIKILYTGTMFTKAGLYRYVLPKLELQDQGFSTIINMVLNNDNGKAYIDHFDVFLHKDLLAWADYIVLPPIVENIRFLKKDIKLLNPNALICMDIDRVYQKLPSKNLVDAYYDVNKQKAIMQNAAQCDLIITPDEEVIDYVSTSLTKIGATNVEGAVLPNLTSEFIYQEVVAVMEKEMPSKTEGVFKIMLYCDGEDYEDVNANRDILQELTKKYPQVEIIFLGDKLSWKTRDAMRDIQHVHVPLKNDFSFANQIAKINPDVAFIPISHRSDFYRTNYKLLELGSIGIPIITYNKEPYNKFKDVLLIGEKKKDIKAIFEDVIKNPEQLEEYGKKINSAIWGAFGYSQEHLNNIRKTFFVKGKTESHIIQSDKQQGQTHPQGGIPQNDFLSEHGEFIGGGTQGSTTPPPKDGSVNPSDFTDPRNWQS